MTDTNATDSIPVNAAVPEAPKYLIFRTVNNMFIIAEIQSWIDVKNGFHTDGYLTKYAAELLFTEDGKIGFRPVLPFAKKDGLIIKDAHILFESEPDAEICNAFSEFVTRVTTGIVVPPKQGIIVQ